MESYLRKLGYTHSYRYPGGMVVACEVKNCSDCGKPMMVGVGHLNVALPVSTAGLEVLRKSLPEEGDAEGVCEDCDTTTH